MEEVEEEVEEVVLLLLLLLLLLPLFAVFFFVKVRNRPEMTNHIARAGALASYSGSPFLNSCRCIPRAKNRRITGVMARAMDNAIWIKIKRRVALMVEFLGDDDDEGEEGEEGESSLLSVLLVLSLFPLFSSLLPSPASSTVATSLNNTFG